VLCGLDAVACVAQPAAMLRVVAVHACVDELALGEWVVVGHCGACASAHLADGVLGEDAFTEAFAVLDPVAALGGRASRLLATSRAIGASAAALVDDRGYWATLTRRAIAHPARH